MKMWKNSRSSAASSFSAANKFNFTLPAWSIAEQVACLLNSNNKLTVVHTASTVMNSPVQYFVELSGQTVLGCVGLRRETGLDKIVHLSVAWSARRLGIGSQLIKTAVQNSSRDAIYMHIREDNLESRSLAARCGFNVIAYIPKLNYNILTFCLFRRNNVSWNRT